MSPTHALSVFKPGFWADILYSWAQYNYYAPQLHQIPYQILWYNLHILIKSKPVCYDSAVQKGVMYLCDIIQDGGFMSYQQFCDRWGTCLTWLQYYSIIDTLPILWKQIIQLQDVVMDMCAITYKMAGFLQPASYLNTVYKEINSYKHAVVHKLCKWESIFGKNIPLNVFLKYIANLYKVSNVTKYRNFQYRFLMFNIYTNVKLYKWKILSTELCSFCHMYPETILHLFYECVYVKEYWAEITQYVH